MQFLDNIVERVVPGSSYESIAVEDPRLSGSQGTLSNSKKKNIARAEKELADKKLATEKLAADHRRDM